MRTAKLALSLLLVGLCNALPQYQPAEGVVDPIGPLGPSTGCPAYTHDCVPFYLCDNGEINTSGTGLIDPRIKPVKSQDCIIPDNPDTPGVCCGIPGATPPSVVPLQICPNGLVCLEDFTCPHDPASLLDLAVTRTPEACYVNPDVIGVCCVPPVKIIDTCPAESVCVPDSLCLGDVLTDDNSYVPFANGGSWSPCALNGDHQNLGVCCRNPVVVTESPYKPADRCGVRNYALDVRSPVKLNKNEAQFGEFPWQAVLFFSNFTFKCGASLVGDRWLLTGAHCVDGYQYGDFKIRLGEWRVDTYDEPLPYVDVDIASITVHPLFNPQNLHNDIAVIELTTPVKPEFHINTLCLPSPSQVTEAGFRCIASGWGKDAFEGAFQAILKKVDVPFVEHKYCQDLLRQTRLGKYFQLDKSFMCAGGEENQDACTGDGGGPLVCEDLQTGTYFLRGITAWGINCGQKDVPGVYVDVVHFIDWINDIMYGAPVAEVAQPSNGYSRK
ncbi:phenoloxidase-activating factor 2-like [Palaemon carinicauda]|uniref:phenoloxidase-activating factor 2-like n=1 Tax=Palaemon carinicauda TaxID=392227 RepID=UPI0035B594A9